jgi:hypothetical protein
MVPSQRCQCEVCGHEWVFPGMGSPPRWCANQECRSREWNGVKKHMQSHVDEIELPGPRKRNIGRPRTIGLIKIDIGEQGED